MTIDKNTDTGPQELGEFKGHEIYPMPMFATLAVADVAAVATWYEQTLGFVTIFKAPDVGDQLSLVHLRRRKYQDLLLTPVFPSATAAEPPATITLSFAADGEIDELAERARAVEPIGRSGIIGPIDTPWNTRDLRVTDPVGHRWVFTGRNPNPDPESAARVKAMFRLP